MKDVILKTNYNFPNQKSKYVGKVRDVYTINSDIMVMITTDKLSAFDIIMPRGIPYKGQVLNGIASYFMQKTKHIVNNWVIKTPHPNVIIGQKCEPFKVEMIVRGYLSGHAWREYKNGARTISGIYIPEGLKENDRLPYPVITPSTKADQGLHDQDISKEEIISKKIVSSEDYKKLEEYSMELYNYGNELAQEKGLILVDTKYEFGKNRDGQILVIDEIHTPDSSRYFIEKTYQENQEKGFAQKQLSKEFVREWLISNNFQGNEGEIIPNFTDEKVSEISERYIDLYERIIGEKFKKISLENLENDIERIVLEELKLI